MAYNSSLTGYPDIVKALDRALESKVGVRLYFDSANARMTFCGRVHTFRHLDRKENSKVYPADHLMHGRSAYDALQVRRKDPASDGRFPVEIIKLDGIEFQIEELTE